MSNIGYKIYKQIDRLEKKKIERFKDIPTTVIGDCMNRTAALPSTLKPLNNSKLIGSAYTVDVTAGDNTLIYYAIDNAKPGDVIIVAGHGYSERALCGEIMVSLAIKREINGLVVHGAIRDKEELSKLNFPVYAVSSSSNGPFKNGPGTINAPIAIGDRVIYPGDIIVGDQSGIITFHPSEADYLHEAAQKVIEKENQMMKSIKEDSCLELAWMYEKLKIDKCEIQEKFRGGLF
ncbi:MAG: hypothetical protein ACTHW2_11805 [Tissierella sp.]|uniref:RraA family protein n=1 Tax=Tissierella sp. TaxID=41274 RepID=UPI003F97D770